MVVVVDVVIVSSSVSEASFSRSFLGAKLPMKTPPLDKADNGREAVEVVADFSTPGSHGYWSLGFKIPAKYGKKISRNTVLQNILENMYGKKNLLTI